MAGPHAEARGHLSVGSVDRAGSKDVAQHDWRQRQAQGHDDGGPQQRADERRGQEAAGVRARPPRREDVAAESDDGGDTLGVRQCQGQGDGGAGRVGDDQRSLDAEALQGSADEAGLNGR